MAYLLRFGIPSLDRLLTGEDLHGTDPTRPIDTLPSGITLHEGESTSLCIIGPDGTGKSILGLHLVSRYAADCWRISKERDLPCILYVSTDLNYQVAKNRLWNKFRLGTPSGRYIPFARDNRYSESRKNEYDVDLLNIDPLEITETTDSLTMSAFLIDKRHDTEAVGKEHLKVGFLDLSRTTAGDDWAYVSRVLALMPQPDPGSPRHLIVVDAVEGFETLVGEKDAFGEPAPRRARVAQIMRLAASQFGKCNFLLITEEGIEGQRVPEVFIADIVIRLREVESNGYLRRTVQIEKARGYAHARGQHPFVIRSGKGSTTGSQANTDDPRIQADSEDGLFQPLTRFGATVPDGHFQAYFHVFRSLNYLSRTTMQNTIGERPPRISNLFASFGVDYLDHMLAGHGRSNERKKDTRCDLRGLPVSSVTALIGDSETQKTRLGEAFLSRSFCSFPETFLDLVSYLIGSGTTRLLDRIAPHLKIPCPDPSKPNDWLALICQEETYRQFKRCFEEKLEKRRAAMSDPIQFERHPGYEAALAAVWQLFERGSTHQNEGVAILLTTQDVDNKHLAREFSRLLKISSTSSWNETSKAVGEGDVLKEIAEEYFCARTICRRLEIHDLSSPVLMHIVQSCVQEAQRLQLGMEQLAPDSNTRRQKSIGIRMVIDDFSVIKSWYPEIRNEPLFLPYLMFYLRREGITSLIINTNSDRSGATGKDLFEEEFRTLVDNRLYTWHVPFYGRDRVAIAAIPPLSENAGIRELKPSEPDGFGELVIDPHFEQYSGLERGEPAQVPLEVRLYQETSAHERFIKQENPFYSKTFVAITDRSDVIVGYSAEEYDALRDFAGMENRGHLNHTLVFQIDEFWSMGRGALRQQSSYLDGEVVHDDGTRAEAVDVGRVFQLSQTSKPSSSNNLSKVRRDFFEVRGYELQPRDFANRKLIDRIPFTWDFGFLLCRKRCWEDASEQKLANRTSSVGALWKALNILPKLEIERNDKPNPPNWRDFMEACQVVARYRAAQSPNPVPIFDLSLLAPESFACLVLEMWASEIAQQTDLARFAEQLNVREWTCSESPSMLAWLAGKEWVALYKVWLLLAEVLDFPSFCEPARSLEFRPREPNPAAVATRHWYKTAAVRSDDFDVGDPLVPCRLPGNFSVRGDWFLAVQEGSRSDRLADRALDLMSSRRANLTRLQMGLGLPTRYTVADSNAKHVRVKLFKCGDDGRRERATYQDMLDLGADEKTSHWLWRSRLSHYDRHSRVFQKWLGRTLLFWTRLRADSGTRWTSGFEIYDQIPDLEIVDPSKVPGMVAFESRCKDLLEELRDCTLK